MADFKAMPELATMRATKGELAAELWPDTLYNVDMAVPQDWLDDAYARGMDSYCEGSNLAGNFITVFPRNGSPGFVAPVTLAGVVILSILATCKK